MDVRAVAQAAAEVAQTALKVESKAVEKAYADAVAGARILYRDGADSVLHEFADFAVDFIRLHIHRIEFRLLVEIDLEGPRIGEILILGGVEEHLLGAPSQLLGVQPHIVGFMPGFAGYVRHTLTSPSYGSQVSISLGNMLRMATSSEASPMKSSLSYSTMGLAAITSLAMPSWSLVATR